MTFTWVFDFDFSTIWLKKMILHVDDSFDEYTDGHSGHGLL